MSVSFTSEMDETRILGAFDLSFVIANLWIFMAYIYICVCDYISHYRSSYIDLLLL